MRSRQRGATLLGLLTIALILGFGLYAGIRLVPMYLEYAAVVRALTQTAKEGGASVQSMRTSLNRRWIVEDIHSIKDSDIQIKPAGGGRFTLRAWYRAEVPFVANVSLVADFDKTVTVGGDPMPGT
jgi:hypothetical protein